MLLKELIVFSQQVTILLCVHGCTVETRVKEPVFIRPLRLKITLSNSLNKNFPEAETGRGSYVIGFMSLRIPQNFQEF